MASGPVTFVHGLQFRDLPPGVVAQAKRCLIDLIGVAVSGRQTKLSRIVHEIDLIGVAVSGRQTKLSRIVHDFAVSQMGASTGGVRLMFDGRRASVTGAAYAGASTIDAFDAHDGHRLTKGHAGVALLPTLFAF